MAANLLNEKEILTGQVPCETGPALFQSPIMLPSLRNNRAALTATNGLIGRDGMSKTKMLKKCAELGTSQMQKRSPSGDAGAEAKWGFYSSMTRVRGDG